MRINNHMTGGYFDYDIDVNSSNIITVLPSYDGSNVTNISFIDLYAIRIVRGYMKPSEIRTVSFDMI